VAWGAWAVVATGLLIPVKMVITLLLFKYRVYDRIQKI
jgi:hypothetical protein